MDWREFLEKDALDGKGANDKIKPADWRDDPPVDDAYGKDIKIKPKKFLNVAAEAKRYRVDEKGDETESSKKITRKQTNSGKMTGLDDAHSNEFFSGDPNPRSGDGGHRGDELGTVEHYKRKLRHGKPVGKPSFSLSSGNYDEGNKVGGHEGRHRARAAMEEGHKTIPTKLVAYSGAGADEYGVGNKKRGRTDMKGLKYEDHRSDKEIKPRTDKKEDTRHPMLGRKKSWEAWLEKKDKYSGMTVKQRKIQESIDNENDSDNQYYTKAWELFLEKNNAIETDHKNDKKEEWDGKFSSSTIRDDVKDDEDDKAISEEEPLDELTDGKLEEVEKLKSWESWLEKDGKQYDDNTTAEMFGDLHNKRAKILANPNSPENIKLEKDRVNSKEWIKNQTSGGYIKHISDKWSRERKNIPKVEQSEVDDMKSKLQKLQADHDARQKKQKKKSWEAWLDKNEKWDKNEKKESMKRRDEMKKRKKDAIADVDAHHKHIKEERKRGENTEMDEIMGDVKNPILYETQDKPRPTPSIMPPNFTPKKPKYVKGVEQTGDNIADERDSLNIQIADSMKSWKSWLEKMQGAGDARFGNQHLTGLDQEPVDNEEDEANILPAKDVNSNENDEKQEETEDKDAKDNKPYKALSHE